MEYGSEAQPAPVEGGLDAGTLEKERTRWTREFSGAKKWLEGWKKQAEKIDTILRDERDAYEGNESRWNLFLADVESKSAMLYGRPPRVSVERRWQDEDDDVARVAGDIAGRLLNTDIERTSDGCKSAYGYALNDRLQCGWGLVRARYVVEWEDVEETPAVLDETTGQELAPLVPASKRKTSEDVETDYVHWQDQMWSPCRHFHEMRWWAQRAQMTREELVARFGEKVGRAVPLGGKPPVQGENDRNLGDEWKRADVWEIWDKERKKTIWFCEEYGVLDMKPDPYELDGFFPFARPLVANATTTKLIPRPDYVIGQDQYTEVNLVTSRIRKLISAVRVGGVYAEEHPEIAQILEMAGDGNLIPCKNWGNLAGVGGLKGSIDWFPVEAIVAAIIQLRDYRRELVDMLGQETGRADIMRGEATVAGTTATENRVKTRMGSVRMQALQDDFARMASDHQNIRMQLISKFFEPQTIAQRSGAQFMKDKQLLGPAIELLKSPDLAQYRIEVKSEAVSLVDMAALKSERMETLASLSQAMGALTPLAQLLPGAAPLIFQAGQWAIAGMRGSSNLESAFDTAVKSAQEAAQQPQQPQPPDPKVQAEQLKLQGTQMKLSADMQKEQLKHQNKLAEMQAETMAHDQQEQAQARWNVVEQTQKAIVNHSLKAQETPKGFGQ